MASSGSFSTTGYEGRYLTFSWSISSQSVANNTTTISWSLKGDGGGTKYFYTQNIKVVIDGVTVYDFPKTSGEILLYDGTVVKTGTYTFTHNADGTRSFSASAEAGIYSWPVNCTGSGTFTLNTIARASQPSCITYPDHTQNVGSFGDTISIHMNRKSSSFTHTVRYAFGSKSGTCIDADTGKAATAVTTGFRWKIPENFMDLLPATTYGSGTIYVDTYNGSTLVGTKYCGFTATVPASVKPACSFTLDDVNNIDDIYGSPVKGLSKIKVTVTTTPAYSSPIASCTITANGATYNGTTATTGLLSTSGSSVVTATVKDKRGRSNSVSYTMNVQNYVAPSVSAVSVQRCNSDGTANAQGANVKVTFSAAVSSMNSKNEASYQVRYKKSTASAYTTYNFAALANKYTVTNETHIFPADINSSYDVDVIATDRHSSASRATSASTAFTLLNFSASGTSVGAGKVAEHENAFEFGIDVYLDKEALYKGKTLLDFFYPVGSIYLAYNHTDPSTLFGGTWVRIEGAFPWFTGATGDIGQTGGERTVTLTENQIPAHNHGGTYTNAGTSRTHAWLASGGSSMGFDTVDTGGTQPHNNMPPYIQISAWRRTA